MNNVPFLSSEQADIVTFKTWPEMKDAIEQFERQTQTQYPAYRKTGGFNSEGMSRIIFTYS